MSRFRYLSDDSWESPSEADDSLDDPTYCAPSTSKKNCVRPKRVKKQGGPSKKNALSSTINQPKSPTADLTDTDGSENSSKSNENGSGSDTDVSKDFAMRLLGGKKKEKTD